MTAGVLTRKRLDAIALDDMAVLILGDRRVAIPYRIAFHIAQSLRVGAKQAAQFDNAPATFWRELAGDDPRYDAPATHRDYRISGRQPDFRVWEVRCSPPLVTILFDGTGEQFSYEDAVVLSRRLRRAAFIAKAWAGDTGRERRVVGMLTDGNAEPAPGVH